MWWFYCKLKPEKEYNKNGLMCILDVYTIVDMAIKKDNVESSSRKGS